LTALVLAIDEAGRYVAAAYAVFLALIAVYVGLMAAKLTRIERALADLENDHDEPKR
jgi:hypothetical protein